MAIEESDEVKRRDKNRRNGGIKAWFDQGRATRNVLDDSFIITQSVHDDMINRGYKLESAEADETGHFLVTKFVKRDDYIP